ncbi:MAG: hypothetical protein HGB03_00315 [Candidatus Yonathbacteria bacterium]|nr:hypothetical protein [Candidatus Yonathbacteria bacterium]NTW47710.1 hypothetical protein [Candidatus Yonathbacteria bacterium]
MELLSLVKIGIHKLPINISGWFKRENSPVDKRHIETTVNVGSVTQHIQQNILIASNNTLPDLLQKGTDSLAQLRQPSAVLPNSLSETIVIETTKEDKTVINKRLDEVVALMNLNRIDEALPLLLTILAEIKNKSTYIKEQTRTYNNLGVIYNQPKPSSDYDKAIEYFNLALEKDPSFTKSKVNLISAYLNKDTTESIERAHDMARALWSVEKTGDVLQVLLWGIYKKSNTEEVFKFLHEEKSTTSDLIENKSGLLNMVSAFYLEAGKFEEGFVCADKAVTLSPDEPEFLTMKAKASMVKVQQNEIPSEFDVVPRLSDYKGISTALDLFYQAEKMAEMQQKTYLLPEIRYGISMGLIWLGKYDESKYKLKQLRAVPDLSEPLEHQINVLDFATHLHNRDFETAYNTLITSSTYSKISYQEKRRISRVFLLNGAPEQAKNLLDELAVEAEQKKDVYYWFDLSTASVLLGNHQEAISSASKVKELTKGAEEELRKTALSHFNAVNYHYSKPDNGENSETDRMVQGMMDFQNEFPAEKIMTPIQAIDESGQLTNEIKDMLTSFKDRYENIREVFKTTPTPVYFLEKTFHRSFAHEITFRNDPEFTIEFNAVDPATFDELKNNFGQAESFVFDYLSLLDLAKMDFLGFLDKLNKPIFIHEELFQKIQLELLQNEIDELRTLWNFLRKSKTVHFIHGDTEADIKLERIDDVFDKWLVQSIKYAKSKKATFVTNDFRMYISLKFEEITPLNIMPILNFWLEGKFIDEKMYSRAIGDLAERFYIFIPYSSDQLFEIVLEDKGKITLRSYHLVQEIFLPGSNVQSFARVFAGFINLFWKTGSLSEDKINWVKFLTNVIVETIDNRFSIVKGSINKVDYDILCKDLEPIVINLGVIWNMAIQNGTRDDLIALRGIVDEALNKEYLVRSKDIFHEKIKKSIEGLTLKKELVEN